MYKTVVYNWVLLLCRFFMGFHFNTGILLYLQNTGDICVKIYVNLVLAKALQKNSSPKNLAWKKYQIDYSKQSFIVKKSISDLLWI